MVFISCLPVVLVIALFWGTLALGPRKPAER